MKTVTLISSPCRNIVMRLLCAGMALSLAEAGEQLRNPSFEEPGGLHWTAAANPPSDPFALPGKVDLSRTDVMGTTHLWQTLDIPDVASVAGTAAMTLQMTSGPPFGKSIAVYLDYRDSGNNPQRLLLLSPDNSEVQTGAKYFSTPFTLPASARRVTGFSIDKTYGGSFEALDFSLNLGLPQATVTTPIEGATIPVGTPVTLLASVDTGGRTITCVEFYSNNTLIGQAQPSVYGEWSYADESHISVMEGWEPGMAMVDYNPPMPEGMFMINGAFGTPLSFAGTYEHWIGAGPVQGTCNVTFSFGSGGTLNAALAGTAPLGTRNLTGGTPDPSAVRYTLNWTNPPAGSHSITAKACYGTNLSVTSFPVRITVGTVTITAPTLVIRRVSATEVELSWPDTGAVWHLESRTSLVSGSWMPVVGVPALADGRYTLRTAMSGPACFYHLRNP